VQLICPALVDRNGPRKNKRGKGRKKSVCPLEPRARKKRRKKKKRGGGKKMSQSAPNLAIRLASEGGGERGKGRRGKRGVGQREVLPRIRSRERKKERGGKTDATQHRASHTRVATIALREKRGKKRKGKAKLPYPCFPQTPEKYASSSRMRSGKKKRGGGKEKKKKGEKEV